MSISLKALRVNKDLTRNQVSEAIGIAETTLANYENFVTIPDITRALALASFYGCTVDDIKWTRE